MKVTPWSISCNEAFEKWQQDLSEVDWFARVLEPCDRREFGSQLQSWKQARTHMRNKRWASVRLEASNCMSVCIIHNYGISTWGDLPLEWSEETIHKVSKVVEEVHQPVWLERITDQPGLDEASVTTFVNALSWISGDIAWTCLFSWAPDLPDFYPRTLEILKAGHLSCGWTHPVRQFPEGNFYYI